MAYTQADQECVQAAIIKEHTLSGFCRVTSRKLTSSFRPRPVDIRPISRAEFAGSLQLLRGMLRFPQKGGDQI